MSGSCFRKFIKGNSGPIRIIFTGDKIFETTVFHSVCDDDPKRESGGWFKREVVPNTKTKEQIRKIETNLNLEIFIIRQFYFESF